LTQLLLTAFEKNCHPDASLSSDLSTETHLDFLRRVRRIAEELPAPRLGHLLAVAARDPIDGAASALAAISVGLDCLVTSPARVDATTAAVSSVDYALEGLPDPPRASSSAWYIARPTRTLVDLEVPAGRLVFLTSGTTGAPKLVPFLQDQVAFLVDSILARLSYRPMDRVLSTAPVTFDYGFYQVLFALTSGCDLHISLRSTLPGEVLRRLDSIEPSIVPTTPAIGRAIARAAAEMGRSFPGVRLVTSTGAPLRGTSVALLRDAFPNARLVPMYGLTECKRVSIAPFDMPADKMDSVGLPLTGTTVRIAGLDGRSVPRGTFGEAVVEGPHVAHGYWGGRSLASPFSVSTSGVWSLATGDEMSVDDDGYLYHRGRIRRDIVKLHDERVSLVSGEEGLRDISGVREAILTAELDDDSLTSRLLLTIACDETVDDQELSSTVGRILGPMAKQLLEIRRVDRVSVSSHGKLQHNSRESR
jgi:acyl-coenzyme A synthetase/AMP-(fatty) acid ligase